MPNSRVATYKQSYTTRYRTIRRISLRCEAGAHHVETDPLKTASLLHGNKVSKPIEIENEIEIEIEIEMQRAGAMRCGRTKETVQSSVSIGTVKTYAWLVTAAASSMSTSGRKV